MLPARQIIFPDADAHSFRMVSRRNRHSGVFRIAEDVKCCDKLDCAIVAVAFFLFRLCGRFEVRSVVVGVFFEEAEEEAVGVEEGARGRARLERTLETPR